MTLKDLVWKIGFYTNQIKLAEQYQKKHNSIIFEDYIKECKIRLEKYIKEGAELT